ncbi:DUF2971 domain-containing protein [Halorhodospira halophila]|uniref:DUF2971 domain-containing protein n=1 Tax=Halorhodospira halophila TaxID=1053 RepID=UPI0019141463
MADALARQMCSNGELTFDEATDLDYREMLRSSAGIDNPIVQIAMAQCIYRAYETYKPEENYFVSFARVPDEPLLWSHYAGRHEGFCLVFRSVNSSIWQYKEGLKRSITRKTPRSFSPNISQGLPESFTIRDITYEEQPDYLNAFYRFPESVANVDLSEQERRDLASKQQKHYFTKSRSWEYECESRITLRSPASWLFGERVEYSRQERLFRFEPSQLVGVILGARASYETRERVLEIVAERGDEVSASRDYKRTIFDCLVQQAELSTRGRQIVLKPTHIFGLGDCLTPENKGFEKRLSDWEKGCGLQFDGKRGARKVFAGDLE